MAFSGHGDVDVPLALRGRLGGLLAEMEGWLRLRGVSVRRVAKEEGGHITPWWLYAVLDPAAPSRSRVVFGETKHEAVNPTPHMWARGKATWHPRAMVLLRDFIKAAMAAPSPLLPPSSSTPPSPPPPPARPPPRPDALTIQADFDGRVLGPEYLVMEAGAQLVPLAPPCAPEGWAYGRLIDSDAAGWYPPSFAV